ncbi:alpha-amylase family glycosyl hydrolase [Paenibacillus andongensis]|uniref:alpha-amylase family glycosyl hydrolase n=1 Tax=Paenibacillus andongensis TaxID=2975482 RepID=UPI0021BAEC57|nr:alpha-amylase family glycosyl hydrolase [Paenibacillus andongensis]
MSHLIKIAWLLMAMLLFAVGCSKDVAPAVNGTSPESPISTARNSSGVKTAKSIDEQPGNIYYEIFVRSYADSNGDGIGDLNGVTSKLDYLKDLGIGGIWLMPINPSPSYHGYDVTDYYGINSQYGTLEDMKKLLDEAHKRKIKVIMDLVVNHTSSKHPWFISSAEGVGSPYRNWYTWAGADDKMPGDGAAGAKPWHSLNGSNYLGIFWDGMPDLNFDNLDVRKEMVKVGQFWLKQGMDGFRLDAAKHIYGDFNSTQSTPETVKKNQAWWQEFRAGMNEVNKDAYIIGEVWDSPVVIAPYLDKFNSSFNFDLAKKLITAADSEKAEDVAFFLSRIYELYAKSSNGTFIDAPFLSNHDQNRVMSELKGNMDHAKMAAAILLTLPGNPFIYYGEEIGMKGVKPDEYLREPMIWNEDGKSGSGQTTWEASRYNKDDAPSVEIQLKDTNSLLNHYKKMIQWRNEEDALRNGGIGKYMTGNGSVTTFIRATDKQKLLVVHNFSGKEQTIDLGEDKENGAFKEVKLFTQKGWKMDGNKLTVPAYTTVILN